MYIFIKYHRFTNCVHLPKPPPLTKTPICVPPIGICYVNSFAYQETHFID